MKENQKSVEQESKRYKICVLLKPELETKWLEMSATTYNRDSEREKSMEN
jgi:hypothetical protein